MLRRPSASGLPPISGVAAKPTVLDRRAEAVPHHAVGGAIGALRPTLHVRAPGLGMQQQLVASVARRQAGFADVIFELLGVGAKAAVAGRPVVGDGEFPTANKRRCLQALCARSSSRGCAAPCRRWSDRRPSTNPPRPGARAWYAAATRS